MGFLTKSPAVDRSEAGLEELLSALAMYGQPKIGMYSDRGWHCHVNMHVTAVGASFEIKSDFAMESPILATRQCYSRLQQTLRDLAGEK